MFVQEIEQLHELTKKAIDCLERDRLSSVRAILSKIKRLPKITEQARCITMIEALMLLKRKKKYQAKCRILSDNYAAWGSPDLWDILRMCNPMIDDQSKLYKLTLKGGNATFGLFTQFSAEHVCDLEVVANTFEEACEYAQELCKFAAPQDICILNLEESASLDNQEIYRGIISTSPFRIDEYQQENVI